MTFRTRLRLAVLAAALPPLALLALGVRRELTARLGAAHTRRAESLARIVGEDLTRESASIADRLAALGRRLGDDNRLRIAILHHAGGERAYMRDWAAGAMQMTGLSMLQLLDEEGRILSSGHFRNEYDRLAPQLPRALSVAPGGKAIVRVRGANGGWLALARADSLRLGTRRFTLVGGVRVDDRFLARFERDGALAVRLETPDSGAPAPAGAITAELPLTYIDGWDGDDGEPHAARFVVEHSVAELETIRQDVDRWFLIAVLAAIVGALALATWLSARLSHPIAELARATSAIDLDRLELRLDGVASRDDEIGILARRLAAMTRRLRASAVMLREAERQATVGEMARQVNHDIKNGLVPIRHVLRHLVQVMERRPETLPSIFAERRGTLESSIAYLETLARTYARLGPRIECRPVDANAVVREVADTVRATGPVEVRTNLSTALPPVLADPIVLRRILDNLTANATESLPADGGRVALSTERSADGSVQLVIADTGRGMTRDELAHAFDDFFTTKSYGTGLGLSVVRRLVSELQGSLEVESEPQRGTTFTITLPSVDRP